MTINTPDQFREDPLNQVRRVYIGFAQGLFHAAPRGSFHWDPNPEMTEIIITDENTINMDVVGVRPAITFTRSPVQFFGLGLDDLDKYDFRTGFKQKSMLIPGTMSINCCSRNDLESENLAWLYAEQLWMHRELLMRAGMFEIGRQMVVGSPSPPGSIVQADSADEWYVTTVQSPFQFYRTSRATPLGEKIIQDISINRQMIRGTSGGQGPVASPSGANLPFLLEEQQQDGLMKLKDPDDPTREVTVRSVHPFRPGIQPPRFKGRAIPIPPKDMQDLQAYQLPISDEGKL